MGMKHRTPLTPQKIRMGQMRWWWLSFVNDEKWLGACCVEGTDIHDCVDIAWKAGCNPGGGVMATALFEGQVPPPQLQYKLVTDEHMLELLVGPLFDTPHDDSQCVDCQHGS